MNRLQARSLRYRHVTVNSVSALSGLPSFRLARRYSLGSGIRNYVTKGTGINVFLYLDSAKTAPVSTTMLVTSSDFYTVLFAVI